MKGHENTDMKTRVTPILGIPVDHVTVEQIFSFTKRVISENRKGIVLYLNIHGANLARRHRWFLKLYREADLVYCDGDGIRWGLKLLGYEPPPKVSLTRFMWDLAAFCARERFSLFFLGGRPRVAERAAQRLRTRYRRLSIVGTHHGHFDHQGQENENVLTQINSCKPHILLIGFGMPLQEKWLVDNKSRLNVPVLWCAGGVFDFISGRLPTATLWAIRHQMEWLFRLWLEPQRLFARYIFGIPRFFFKILLEKFLGVERYRRIRVSCVRHSLVNTTDKKKRAA